MLEPFKVDHASIEHLRTWMERSAGHNAVQSNLHVHNGTEPDEARIPAHLYDQRIVGCIMFFSVTIGWSPPSLYCFSCCRLK